ncbi:MAG: hypothetical protein LBN23_01580 [Paludibacter sp.]|jgi:hypothetical protein|nr:hypothetical protein [Paludibacter sp.]
MKKILLISLAFVAVMCVNAQVIFQETFNNVTVGTAGVLTSGLTDQTGYVVGGGGSAMTCDEAGTMTLLGGRFETKHMDLSGSNLVLSITYKVVPVSGQDSKRFQIDIDKNGTSGMGGILQESQPNSPTTFTTKEFPITGGTADSYLHFRTESSHTIIIDEIKVTKGGSSSVTIPVEVKEIKSVNYFSILGKEVPATTKGLVFVKTLYKDGTTDVQKFYKK